MEKWEYQVLIAEKSGKGVFGHVLPREASWKVHWVNGESVANWTDMTLYNYLNKIGEQGWETSTMTSHLTIRTGQLPIEHLYVIVKRAKSASS